MVELNTDLVPPEGFDLNYRRTDPETEEVLFGHQLENGMIVLMILLVLASILMAAIVGYILGQLYDVAQHVDIINPDYTRCLDGTVLQGDGSCLSQE